MGTSNLVIVGAGHAGGRAAQAAREAGFAGRITIIGEESYLPYERPPVSKQLLASSMEANELLLKDRQFYENQRIKLQLGQIAAEIDRRAQRVSLRSGETVPYDTLLLATGARARRLDARVAGTARIHHLRGINDSLLLRADLVAGRHLLVVGAGFIGLEVASVARQIGCEVTIVEQAPLPLARVVGPEIGEYLVDLHRRQGVTLRTGRSVVAVEQLEHKTTLTLDDDTQVTGDALLVCIGARPNTELAVAAGLDTDDGIVVDEYGRTSDPAIFAAGDVANQFNLHLGRSIRFESWQNAQDQAGAVGRVIAGKDHPFLAIPWFWSDQYNTKLQIVGVVAGDERIVRRGSRMDSSFALYYERSGVVVAAIAINSPADISYARELIAKVAPVDHQRLDRTGNASVSRSKASTCQGCLRVPIESSSMMPDACWTKVARSDELREGRPLGVVVTGKHLALYRIDGRLFATSDVCTHAFALLSEGVLDGDEIECPLHLGRFNARTGKALGMPVEKDLETFPVRQTSEGDVEVNVRLDPHA